MNQKPFKRLFFRRRVRRPDLPDDLAQFYSRHRGVGLESSPDRMIRFCTTSEVQLLQWSDLEFVGGQVVKGWEDFSGFRLGITSFFEDIVYVVHCPRAPRGAIMVLGADICGPGGKGEFPFECALVLAESFTAWIQRLETMGWTDFGLNPREVPQLPQPQQSQQYAYYKNLNPDIDWYQR